MREVKQAMERVYENREKRRQRRNAEIRRPSAGTRVAEGNLVLAQKSSSFLHRQGTGPKLAVVSGGQPLPPYE